MTRRLRNGTILPTCRAGCDTVVDAFGDVCADCTIGDCIYCGGGVIAGLTMADGRVVCTICLGAD
jgi:hypothetical protein